MINSYINKIPFQSNLVGVNHLEATHPDAACTILVTFADTNKKSPTFYYNSSSSSVNYKFADSVNIGGIPLSVTSFYDDAQLLQYEKENAVAKRKCGQYYALDVIVMTGTPDTTEIDSRMRPSEASTGFSGVRLTNVKINGRHFLAVQEDATNTTPFDKTVVSGIPMLICSNGQLVVNNITSSDYAFDKISQSYKYDTDGNKVYYTDIQKVWIGGLPLTAGRIGKKYYLFVYTGEFSSVIPLPTSSLLSLLEGDFGSIDSYRNLLEGDWAVIEG